MSKQRSIELLTENFGPMSKTGIFFLSQGWRLRVQENTIRLEYRHPSGRWKRFNTYGFIKARNGTTEQLFLKYIDFFREHSNKRKVDLAKA